jgi:hypothetical protein
MSYTTLPPAAPVLDLDFLRVECHVSVAVFYLYLVLWNQLYGGKVESFAAPYVKLRPVEGDFILYPSN